MSQPAPPRSHEVDDLQWNYWTKSFGMTGRIRPDSVDDFIGIRMLWLARGTAEASTKRAFEVAVLVGDAIGFLIAVMATLSGNVSSLGWGVVALYLILALGFGYFLLPRASRA